MTRMGLAVALAQHALPETASDEWTINSVRAAGDLGIDMGIMRASAGGKVQG
jgi:hypothetical protein